MSAAGPDPMAEVRAWFDAAREAGVHEPEAAALATASPDGRPSVRIVLIRGIDPRGISWYTNRESRKGRELAANPRASVAFHWAALERQVRLEGPVEPLGDEESDAYFAGRPHGSRIGAWASRQGTVIPDAEFLDARVAEFAARYPDDVPRPPYWGGYLLRPDAVELWQGRPSRLHDRIHFVREGDGWRTERLSP
ncbi:MAG TPA: pyridoxamine 5'-phosphate oxidase [Solirubrobacteraceae bacterium]|nr:pyridoxamine 5'-phosphate oxidase [Solirubrobacteraceae bacterium]